MKKVCLNCNTQADGASGLRNCLTCGRPLVDVPNGLEFDPPTPSPVSIDVKLPTPSGKIIPDPVDKWKEKFEELRRLARARGPVYALPSREEGGLFIYDSEDDALAELEPGEPGPIPFYLVSVEALDGPNWENATGAEIVEDMKKEVDE